MGGIREEKEMSMVYCDVCDKQIDTDFNAEHFEEHDEDS